MGKRITIYILLICILGGAFWQHSYVTGSTEKLSNDLNQIYGALREEDFEEAFEASQTFNENWEKEKRLYETLFKHEEVDLISASASRISELCAERNKSEALAETAETQYYIKHIHEIDSIKWENVF